MITFQNVSEKYRIKFIAREKVSWKEIWALDNISLQVKRGEVLGVIGQNGAGKTTLLKLIAGMLMPDKGRVDVEGKVSTLMELGAGFNPEFTGRENLLINAKIYGLDEKALGEKIGKIIAFAGIGEFIDAPIKYYSQGMYMRLAFALAIYVEPDVLLIDDILAVGDEEAQQKCVKKIAELKQSKKTIVVVSHDMNMIRKLCDRVILLEKGALVHEGDPEETIARYLEVVGSSQGIAVLSFDSLRAVFNNGRISISYDNFAVTKGGGGCAYVFSSDYNIWMPSFNLSWQIREASAAHIEAQGYDRDGKVVQEWALKLTAEQLHWQVKIQDSSCKDAHLDLLLEPSFASWVSLEKEGVFPPFAHKFNWQEISLCDELDKRDALGLCTSAGRAPEIKMVFQAGNNQNDFKLYNTGYDQESRLLKLLAKGDTILSERMTFFFTQQAFDRHIAELKVKALQYIAELRAKLLIAQAEEKERQRQLRTIRAGAFSVYAEKETKSIRLYCDDQEITGHAGIYAKFSILKQWFSLDEAAWEVSKKSAQHLEILLRYPSLPLDLTWTCILGKDLLEVSVDLKAQQKVALTSFDMHFELLDGYKSWKTAYENGDFSAGQYINEIAPVRLKENKVSKIRLEAKEAAPIKGLLCENVLIPQQWILGIYKQKARAAENICLHFSRIIPQKESLIEIGLHQLFACSIHFNKESAKIKESYAKARCSLNAGALKVEFEEGKGKIFFKDEEITSGLAMYTSVRSGGIWYDSHQALWRICEQNACSLTARGEWPYIPIAQTWSIELTDEKTISWKTEMELYEEASLELAQSNLMLQHGYSKWRIADLAQGEFIDDFTDDYDILPFRFWYGKPKIADIEAFKISNSRVRFSCRLQDNAVRVIVENTDYLYRARLLQFQKAHPHLLSAKKYPYFEGVIQIEG